MAATETITLKLVAVDLLSGNVTKAISGLDALAKRGGLVGSVMQGVGQSFGQMLNPVGLVTRGIGMFTDALGDAVNAAREDQVSQVRLRAALEANIEAWDGNADAIEDVISARTKLGFQDDEQRSVLAGLVAITEDLNDALAIERTAMDLARLKGIDLASAAKVLGNAYAGATGQLAKMGIRLGKGVSGMEALEAVQGRVAGQAEEYARTAAGASDRMNIAIGELSESIGYLISGPIADIAGGLADLAGQFTTSNVRVDAATRYINDYGKAAESAADALEHLNDVQQDSPMELYAKSFDLWMETSADALQQETLNLQAMSGAGAGIYDLAQWMKDLNRTLAFSSGAPAEALGVLAQKVALAGGTFEDFVTEVQRMTALGVDLQGMAMRYVKDFDVMDMTTGQFLATWRRMGDQVQSGKMKWQDWGRTMVQFIPWIEKHWAELPETLQASLLKANLGLDESLTVMKTTTTGMVEVMRERLHAVPTVFRSALTPLTSIVKGTLKQAKEQAKRDMADLAWALKHPMEDSKIKQVWVGELRGAYKALHRAQETNNRIAIAKAQALIDGLRSKIFELDMAQLAIRVDYTLRGTERPLGNPPPPPRAKGGPVSPGGTYVVGEHEPETLVMGATGGYVIPDGGRRAGWTGGGGGGNVNVTVVWHSLVMPTEAEADRVAARLAPALNRHLARVG